MKTHWKKLTNPDYLGAYSLAGENGYEERVYQIQQVKQEMVIGADGKKEQCMVAHLIGEKPMILNVTNCKAIAKVAGSSFVEDWAGVHVTVYVERVKAFGDVVDTLRIRPKAPTPPVSCQNCGRPVTPAFSMSVPALVEYSKANCGGKIFCAACMKALKAQRQKEEEANATEQQ